jgi:hypothetical protein
MISKGIPSKGLWLRYPYKTFGHLNSRMLKIKFLLHVPLYLINNILSQTVLLLLNKITVWSLDARNNITRA